MHLDGQGLCSFSTSASTAALVLQLNWHDRVCPNRLPSFALALKPTCRAKGQRRQDGQADGQLDAGEPHHIRHLGQGVTRARLDKVP